MKNRFLSPKAQAIYLIIFGLLTIAYILGLDTKQNLIHEIWLIVMFIGLLQRVLLRMEKSNDQ